MANLKQWAVIGVAVVGFYGVNKMILEPRAEAAAVAQFDLNEGGTEIYRGCREMMKNKEFTHSTNSESEDCGCIAGQVAESIDDRLELAFADSLRATRHDDVDGMVESLSEEFLKQGSDGLAMMIAFSTASQRCVGKKG